MRGWEVGETEGRGTPPPFHNVVNIYENFHSCLLYQRLLMALVFHCQITKEDTVLHLT